MTLRDRPAALAFRLRHPKTTVRWRLTLLYGGLFLASGAVLLAITYTLVARANTTSPFSFVSRAGVPPRLLASAVPRNITASGAQVRVPSRSELARIRSLLHTNTGAVAARIVGSGQRISDLHQLVIESAVALAIMAAISTALGWLVAGRVLSPLRTITAATQQISEANLDRRLAMDGPRDELRDVADTIDGLLGRLQGAFDTQRRFVANASHELRTPVTAARALLEMVLGDPDATVETFRTTCQEVLEESVQQAQLIDALLALAHGQRGIDRRDPIDLAEILAGVLQAQRPAATRRGLHLDVSLEPATVSGDARLLERLASNLLDNAIRHNIDNGHVRVRVAGEAGRATLTIANSGPSVPADEIDRLLQPFQRLTPDRVGHDNGLGLGLSIVAAIASAHDATLVTRPGTNGGLDVQVRFPVLPSAAVGADPERRTVTKAGDAQPLSKRGP